MICIFCSCVFHLPVVVVVVVGIAAAFLHIYARFAEDVAGERKMKMADI